MIISEIHIDGFGIFSDYSLTGFKKGINLLLGNNEAGKSTLLKFIRYTLFGYPRLLEDRMPPLYGGQHGGRIKMLLSPGKEVIIQRRGDNLRDLLLQYDNKESRSASDWSQMTGYATSDLFSNVYAITLDELSSLGSLSASGVEDKIFSVGLGLGSMSIGEVEKTFREEAEAIYADRGRKKRLQVILKEIDAKKARIKEIQQNLPRYQQISEETETLEKEIHILTQDLTSLRGEATRLDNYLRCYGSFVTYSKAREGLEALPDLQDYPEKGLTELEKLEEEAKEIREQISTLNEGSPDEKGIRQLKNEIEGIRYNEALLSKKEEVLYLRSNLEKYKSTLLDNANDLQKTEKLNNDLRQSIRNINSSWDEKTVKEYGDLTERRDSTVQYIRTFEEIRQKKLGYEAEIKALKAKGNNVNIKRIFEILAIIMLLLAVPAFFYDLLIAGITAVVIAVILFAGKKYFISQPVTSQPQQELEDLLKKEEGIKKEYRDFLERELHLPGTLSPEAVPEVLKNIEMLQDKILERDELLRKAEDERLPFLQDFEKRTRSLAALSREASGTEDVETLAITVIQEYERSRERSDLKDRLSEELERKNNRLLSAQKELEKIRQAMQELIRSLGAADADDFRKKYEKNNKVRSLLDQQEAAIKAMETLVGIGRAEEVIRKLKTVEKEMLEDELRERQQEISGMENDLSLKKEELGGKKKEKEQLESESELAGLLTELETEIQRLKDAYREWLANKMALKILKEVRERYEQEKQPAVIKYSGVYFNKITGGRYPQIRVSLDDNDVSVIDRRGAVKKLDQLSRGTREQLLISLRLGLIEEYEKGAEPLPVIVDEVFVNFDEERARQTAAILQEFAQERQILIFTCHPEMENLFSGATNKIPVYAPAGS